VFEAIKKFFFVKGEIVFGLCGNIRGAVIKGWDAMAINHFEWFLCAFSTAPSMWRFGDDLVRESVKFSIVWIEVGEGVRMLLGNVYRVSQFGYLELV